jgi:hypothetical protein
VLTAAKSINDNGYIVGNAHNNLLGITSQAFILTPVPEPGTSLMFLTGLGLCILIFRGRKQ